MSKPPNSINHQIGRLMHRSPGRTSLALRWQSQPDLKQTRLNSINGSAYVCLHKRYDLSVDICLRKRVDIGLTVNGRGAGPRDLL